MKLKNLLSTMVVLLAGLTAGYFASRGARDILSELPYNQSGFEQGYEELPHSNISQDSISEVWVMEYFGPDSAQVKNMTFILNDYYKVRTLGNKPPSMLWIVAGDRLGGSSVVFSNIYVKTRGHFQEVINEGLLAVKGAIKLKDLLLEARKFVTLNEEAFDRIIGSMDYEIERFRLLDYYRQFYMNYYHWLDTGEPRSKTSYQLAAGQFQAVLDFHEQKYGKNSEKQVLDFEESRKAMAITNNTGRSVRWARVVVVISLFLLVLGIPGLVRDRANRRFAGTLYFDAVFRPSIVDKYSVYHGTKRMALFMLALYMLGLVIFSAFFSLLFPMVIGGLGLAYVLILTLLFNRGGNFMNILISLMAPKLLMMAFILLIIAIRGPIFFWYLMWVSDLFKMLFVSLFFMFLFRKFQVYLVLGKQWSEGKGSASFPSVFMALGIQLLVAGIIFQFFGLEHFLTVLNNDLLVLPGGLSKFMGISTHFGIPPELPIWIIYFAMGLIIVMLSIYHSFFQRIFRLIFK